MTADLKMKSENRSDQMTVNESQKMTLGTNHSDPNDWQLSMLKPSVLLNKAEHLPNKYKNNTFQRNEGRLPI